MKNIQIKKSDLIHMSIVVLVFIVLAFFMGLNIPYFICIGILGAFDVIFMIVREREKGMR